MCAMLCFLGGGAAAGVGCAVAASGRGFGGGAVVSCRAGGMALETGRFSRKDGAERREKSARVELHARQAILTVMSCGGARCWTEAELRAEHEWTERHGWSRGSEILCRDRI